MEKHKTQEKRIDEVKKENKILKKSAMVGKLKGSLVEQTKTLQKKIEAEMEGLAELELEKSDLQKDNYKGEGAEAGVGKPKADGVTASRLKKLQQDYDK